MFLYDRPARTKVPGGPFIFDRDGQEATFPC